MEGGTCKCNRCYLLRIVLMIINGNKGHFLGLLWYCNISPIDQWLVLTITLSTNVFLSQNYTSIETLQAFQNTKEEKSWGLKYRKSDWYCPYSSQARTNMNVVLCYCGDTMASGNNFYYCALFFDNNWNRKLKL